MMCGVFQFSRAAITETYSQREVSTMASSASLTFAAAQRVHLSFLLVDFILDSSIDIFLPCEHFFLVPVIETDEKVNGIVSVEFSPVRSTHVAVGGLNGAEIIDIRQPKE